LVSLEGSLLPCAAPALLAQLVEHLHGKEGVDGSSPSEGSAIAPHVGAFAFRLTCRGELCAVGMEPFVELSRRLGTAAAPANDHRDQTCGRCAAARARAVRVYAAQRKPVAWGRGASGLAGRPPGGSSSAGRPAGRPRCTRSAPRRWGASAWNKAASSSICPGPTPSSPCHRHTSVAAPARSVRRRRTAGAGYRCATV
jgi:hypothetical protein